jgi:hypothetical protein
VGRTRSDGKNGATEQLMVLHFCGDGDIKQRLVIASFVKTEIITAGGDVGFVMERRICRQLILIDY